MKTILFLCTGNYYRSRFAEEWFNHHAEQHRVPWQAASRGLAPDISALRNPGPISPLALDGLSQRGIAPRHATRFPRSVEPADLVHAARIVALYEPEHRPMIHRHHPAWLDRIEFWQIGDVEQTAPDAALAALDLRLTLLANELAPHPAKPALPAAR